MLNSIIGLFHKMENPILWKGESLVIVSLIIAMIWQAIGYYMVMYMASMASVPKSLYESAGLDGAGRLVQFFQITIPLIWTNIRTTLTFFIISTINMAFLFVKAMTSGGPNGASEVSLSYMYGQKDAGLYGYSMAIGVVIFIFSFALSALVNKVTEREPLEFKERNMRREKNSDSAERLYKFFIYFSLIMLAVSIIIPVAWVLWHPLSKIKSFMEIRGLCRRVFIFRTLLMPGIQQKWEITC